MISTIFSYTKKQYMYLLLDIISVYLQKKCLNILQKCVDFWVLKQECLCILLHL